MEVIGGVNLYLSFGPYLNGFDPLGSHQRQDGRDYVDIITSKNRNTSLTPIKSQKVTKKSYYKYIIAGKYTQM